MIQILSRDDAVSLVTSNPDYPIIIIGETYNNDYERVSSIARNCLVLRFEDIIAKRTGYVTVKQKQIKEALRWAKGKEDLAVACRAGVSRSSAIAYLIEVSRTSPEEGLKILSTGRHDPNELIIEMGSKIMGNAKIKETVDGWLSGTWRFLAGT